MSVSLPTVPLPPLAEILDSLVVVSLPMSTRFRGVMLREAALFEGPAGWTEFSPFVEYDTAEASAWLAAAIEFGWDDGPTLRRHIIPANASVPLAPADEVPSILARYGDPRAIRSVKVKVAAPGGALEDDRERLQAVRETLGDDVRLRIDANGHWSVDQARAALTQLSHFHLEYAEQPVATVEELAALRSSLRDDGIPVPIAADESIRKSSDPERVARAEAADLIIIKAQPLGGIRRALDVVRACGLPAVVSSALDTAIGISMGARLAAALPTLEHDCGLGTTALFPRDVVAKKRQKGDLAVSTERVVPSPERLDALQADTDREGWWRSRLEACYRFLADSAV